VETQDHLGGFHAELPSVALVLKRGLGQPLSEAEQAEWDGYQKRHTEAQARRDAIGLVDLGEIMEGGDTESDMLVEGLLVEGMHHLVYGKKESGKTWLLLACVKQLIDRGETVVWVDEEMGRRDFADRLYWMGLTPDDVSEHFVYLEFPVLNGSNESRALWAALLELKKPSLIVIDAQTEVLATADLNENSGTDVAKWLMWYLAPARRLGAATAVIDHTGHEEQGRARGSGHKGAQSKVELSITKPTPFSKDSLGVIKVTEEKNTPSAAIPKTQFFELGAEATADGSYTFVFRPTSPVEKRANAKELERRQKIIAVVEGAKEPPSKTRIHDKVGGNKQSVLNAIDTLVDEGELVGQEGTRGIVYVRNGSDNE
jgi:archaellum biogenesis ATPase FlaH